MENIPVYLGTYLSAASLVIAFGAKGNPHWSKVNLLVGVTLILIATLSFAMLSDLSLLFDLMLSNGEIDKATHYASKSNATAWGYVLPAITAAIGANILSAWFLAERPHQS